MKHALARLGERPVTVELINKDKKRAWIRDTDGDCWIVPLFLLSNPRTPATDGGSSVSTLQNKE